MNILLTDIAPVATGTQVNDISLFILACVGLAFLIIAAINIIILRRARKSDQQATNVQSIIRHALEMDGVNVVLVETWQYLLNFQKDFKDLIDHKFYVQNN